MAIAGDPGTKGLGGKTRALEQASYKNLTIDLRIDVHRPTHEYAPFENQVIVPAADIHRSVTNPRIFDGKFHVHHLTLRSAFNICCGRKDLLMPVIRTTALDIDPEQGRRAEQRPKEFSTLKRRLEHRQGCDRQASASGLCSGARRSPPGCGTVDDESLTENHRWITQSRPKTSN
jgi:hypothetical protein